MYDKLNYPKIHYQFYRGENKENLNLNNHQDNYRYNMNSQLNMNDQLSSSQNKQQGKKMNSQIDNRANSPMMKKNRVNKNRAALKRKKATRKKIVLGSLVVRAGLDYLYPKDVEVFYGMLLANKKLLRIKPELFETCREIGKNLRKT